jgi:C-terminal processing protease CtpA/Prc
MTRLLLVTALTLLQIGGPQPEFGPKQRQEVVKSISSLLVERYLSAPTGQSLALELENALARGEFEAATHPEAFAAAVTDLLQREAHDRHLWIWYRDGAAAQLQFAVLEGPMIARAVILPGNIGYVDVRHFVGRTTEFDAAMEKVKDAAALVVDLRRCAGGNREQLDHFSTYFFSKRTRLLNRQARSDSDPVEGWTADEVPGPRFPRIAVYILTSRQTFSAAEGFALGLRVAGRAVLVGEKTGGGGHFVQGLTQLPDGFQMLLPVGRNIDPRSGRSWEGEGVAPDLEVNPEQALQAAIGHFYGWRR